MNNKAVHILSEKARNELFNNILPFWLQHSIDDTFGGFHGRLTNNLDIEKHAPKGLILNTRILWLFPLCIGFSRSKNIKRLQTELLNML